jgi:hypothetical protein
LTGERPGSERNCGVGKNIGASPSFAKQAAARNGE